MLDKSSVIYSIKYLYIRDFSEKNVYNLAIRLKLREDDGHTFADIDQIHLNWADVGGMHFQLDNLFNGNKELEDSAHAIFNENWHSIYEIMEPTLSKSTETVLKDIIGKILAHFPVSFLWQN